MYWKSNSCLRSGFINILFPHSVQQPCQFWYIVNAKINLFLLPYEPKDRIQLKVCSPFLHHQQNCWLGNTRSRSGIPVLGNVRSRSDVPVLSRVCIYSREGLDLRRVQCLCQTGRMEHIFRSCLWGFQTVPSLLARKHALELITARFSLFLSPKLALSHLIESGLLKTWSGTMGRSSEGHGICSGCVPIMQVLNYCVCRTVWKVGFHLPLLHTALYNWVIAWAGDTFSHLGFLFFIIFWQETYAAEENPHSNCLWMTENQQNGSSVWLHSDQSEKGNRCSQLRFWKKALGVFGWMAETTEITMFQLLYKCKIVNKAYSLEIQSVFFSLMWAVIPVSWGGPSEFHLQLCVLQKNVFLQKLKCQAVRARRKLPLFQVIKTFPLYFVYTLSFYLYFLLSSTCCFKKIFL